MGMETGATGMVPGDRIYTGERRGDLLQINLPLLKQQTRTVLCHYDQVAGAYLFGSALDFVRPQSDIDIGLVLKPTDIPSYRNTIDVEVEGALRRLGPHPFHVTILEEDSLQFSHNVLTKGDLFYIGDYDLVTDFIVRIIRGYEEFSGMVIRMYPYNHHPPHIHAEHGEFEAVVNIRTVEIMHGSLPRRAERDLLEWTRNNQERLLVNWERVAQGKYPERI